MQIPYLDQLFLPVILFLVQTQHFCDFRLLKDQIWCSHSNKIVFPIYCLFPLFEYLYHFYVVMDYGLLLRFLFVFFSLLLLLLSLFSLVFISGQNFITSSKNVAASTAVVELIIRTITLTIVCYSRELPVQQIFIEQLSIQH